MSLYRSYRPRQLADVIGQDHIVTTLEQAVAQGKIAHAYLFSGPRGTGKTSIARILAKTLMTDGIEDEALRAQIAKSVEEGSIVDLIEIDAASNRRIDDVRSLLEGIQFSPVAAKRKVYIIDEAHMLTKEAFNALLKTLEEPPPYAYFILATTELHKVPATIQSRCQRFLFRQIREEDIIRMLQSIADQERIVIDRAALRAIAHHAQGGMRDAIAMLDQLRSLEKIGLEDVKDRIGETGHEYVEETFKALETCDSAAILQIVERMEQTAVPPEGFLRLLLSVVRDELHRSVAEKTGDSGRYVRMLDTVLSAMRDLRAAPVPGLVLETTLLRLCAGDAAVEPAPARSPAAPRAAAPAPVPEPARPAPPREAAAPPADKPAEEPAPAATVEAPAFTIQQVIAAWEGIVKAVEPASVKMSLKNGRVSSVDGSVVVLSFTSAFHRDKVAAVDACRTVEEGLTRVFKKPVKVKCVLDAEKHAGAADGEVVDLAEMAAEIF